MILCSQLLNALMAVSKYSFRVGSDSDESEFGNGVVTDVGKIFGILILMFMCWGHSIGLWLVHVHDLEIGIRIK